MTTNTRTSRIRQTLPTLLMPASLTALATVPVIAGLVRLAGLVSGQAHAADVRFLEYPLPVALHIAAVIPYSLLAPLQFVPTLRRRAWHRGVGTALVPLGLLAALTGLWMTTVYSWPAGDGAAVYVMRLIVGAAMAASLVRGVVCLVRHEYAAHGAWMLRAYALGMGAGTQVLTHLPWFMVVGGSPSVGGRAVMMGLAWIINALAAEYVIRTRAAGVIAPAQPRPARLSTV